MGFRVARRSWRRWGPYHGSDEWARVVARRHADSARAPVHGPPGARQAPATARRSRRGADAPGAVDLRTHRPDPHGDRPSATRRRCAAADDGDDEDGRVDRRRAVDERANGIDRRAGPGSAVLAAAIGVPGRPGPMAARAVPRADRAAAHAPGARARAHQQGRRATGAGAPGPGGAAGAPGRAAAGPGRGTVVPRCAGVAGSGGISRLAHRRRGAVGKWTGDGHSRQAGRVCLGAEGGSGARAALVRRVGGRGRCRRRRVDRLPGHPRRCRPSSDVHGHLGRAAARAGSDGRPGHDAGPHVAEHHDTGGPERARRRGRDTGRPCVDASRGALCRAPRP